MTTTCAVETCTEPRDGSSDLCSDHTTQRFVAALPGLTVWCPTCDARPSAKCEIDGDYTETHDERLDLEAA